MAQPLSAKLFDKMYEDLGINTSKLGCIMLDVEEIKVSDVIDEADLYVSDDPDHQYVKGIVSEDVPHVTLLYGLMSSGPSIKKHVDTVLKDWSVDTVEIANVSFFYGDGKEGFVTIVAELVVTSELLEGNARLRFLPHIDTFPEYKPHITLAYVSDKSDYQSYIETLNEELTGELVKVVGLNYGD